MGLLTNILEGKYDDSLGRIMEAIKQRRKIIGMQNLAALQPGDRVRFVSTARPIYLRGVPATVIGRRNTRVRVRLDQPVGRFWGEIIAYPQSLELVDQEKGG